MAKPPNKRKSAVTKGNEKKSYQAYLLMQLYSHLLIFNLLYPQWLSASRLLSQLIVRYLLQIFLTCILTWIIIIISGCLYCSPKLSSMDECSAHYTAYDADWTVDFE
jgi:hypothetical protein